MSTRALYTFLPGDGHEQAWNVYKHHDGYPKGAAIVIQRALDWFAWPLPRYESDAFASAFITAGKAHMLIEYATGEDDRKLIETHYFPGGDYRQSTGGGLRLMPQGNPTDVAKKNCSDIEYRYEISVKKGKLHIKAVGGSWWGEPNDNEIVLFEGPFEKFKAWAKKDAEAA